MIVSIILQLDPGQQHSKCSAELSDSSVRLLFRVSQSSQPTTFRSIRRKRRDQSRVNGQLIEKGGFIAQEWQRSQPEHAPLSLADTRIALSPF
jgi:hypothetical protein